MIGTDRKIHAGDWQRFLSTVDQQAIAEAIAHQNAIDRAEAGPKAPRGAIPYQGGIIDSRWDVLSEYRLMRAVVDTLPDLARRLPAESARVVSGRACRQRRARRHNLRKSLPTVDEFIDAIARQRLVAFAAILREEASRLK